MAGYGVLLRFVNFVILFKAFLLSIVFKLWTFIALACQQRENRQLQIDSLSLNKVPQHLGLLFLEKELRHGDVASIIVWSMAMGISYISVYDRQGLFKENSSELYNAILRKQKEILGPDWSNYTVHLMMNTSSMSKDTDNGRVYVNVISLADGRTNIVKTARKFSSDVQSKKRNIKDLSIEVMDSLIKGNQSLIPDPELAVKFGSPDLLMGFLPWQIRLTEVMCVPSHHRIDYRTYLSVLKKFGNCSQRFGK